MPLRIRPNYLKGKQLQKAEEEYPHLMMYRERLETLMDFTKDARGRKDLKTVEVLGLVIIEEKLAETLEELDLFIDTMTDEELWEEINSEREK